MNSGVDNSPDISHLQYADDTLIFRDAEEDQYRMLRVIFILVEATSELHINWGKCHIYPGNETVEIQALADIFFGGEGGYWKSTYSILGGATGC